MYAKDGIIDKNASVVYLNDIKTMDGYPYCNSRKDNIINEGIENNKSRIACI